MKKGNFNKKHKNDNLANNRKKIFNKVNKIEIKPQFLVIGLVAIITLISLIYFIFLKYSPVMNFKYEGYGVSGKQITENLLGAGNKDTSKESGLQNSNLSGNEEKNVSLAKIEEQGTIFKKLNSYFIGNKEKTEIDLNYPIYINDKNTIYNLNQDITLISKNFEQIAGYPNISITDGKVYNGNSLERADSKEYIFAKTEEGIYINLKEIKIGTTANEYVLPVNSLIVFEEDVIRYYSVQNNILVFNEIKDVDYNSQIIIKNIEEALDQNSQKVDKQYNYEELLTNLGIKENAKNDVEKEEIIEEDTIDDKQENNTESETEPTAPQDQKPENNEQTNAEYIKPEVTVEDFKAEVYTLKSNLNIKDPKARIIEAPTFEIYKDGKIYLRRVFKNSGEIQITGLVPETEYEIIGKYIYLNAENKKIENTFYKGTIKTKGYEALGTIELNKEEGEIYSNKIQIRNVKIISDLQNEAIKGINQIELETGNIKTVLKNNKVNELLEGKEVTIESSEGLKSNTKIEYAIKFYDKNGKELKAENTQGKTRTAKQKPTVKVTTKSQDIVSVTLGLKLSNKDRVHLENYKYVITKPNGEKIKEERLSEHEKEIKLEDLDQNQYYKITVYADYDLGDNKGTQKNVEIGNLVFATKPISTLGSLEMIVENKELTSKNAKIKYKIDEDKTDKRLIQILNELTIKIVENNDDNKEISKPSEEAQNSDKERQHTNRKTTKEGTVNYTNTLTKEEIEKLQLGETKEINYETLKSNTKYTIEITGKVELGNTKEEVPVTYTYKEFTTLKIPVKVEIKNQFVTGNLIDLDVRVEDENNSVLNNKVRMELRDEKSNLIDLQEIETNKDWLRKTYEKLEENKTYKLSFYADQYNEGSTDETYKINYLIKEIEIVTEPGISGSVGLTDLTRKSIGKNLVDVESKIKWHSYNFSSGRYYKKEYNQEENYIFLFGGKYKSEQYYVYDLREYIGETVTVSFKAKKQNDSGEMKAYFGKNKFSKIEELQPLDKENWKEYIYTITVDSSGFVGFLIRSQDDSENGATLLIKDLQIEIGNQKTQYESYSYKLQANVQIDLEDRRNEITNNDYYIRIFENDKLVEEKNYEDILEGVAHTKKTFEVKTDTNYRIELIIKIKEREYILSTQNFSTENAKEIKGIQNKEEYLEIQPEGNYIVLTDLEINNNSFGFGNVFDNELEFAGTINYNGHKVSMNHNMTGGGLFRRTNSKAVIENLVVDIELDNNIETNISGFIVNCNEGIIRNIQINLKKATNVPNIDTYILGRTNFGTVENFYINLESELYGQKEITLGYRDNYGTIKNGYIVGENINAPYEITENRNIGTVTINNGRTGIIKNIYSLITVEVGENNNNLETIGNIAVNNTDSAIIENVYSVKNIYEKNLSYGPTVYSKKGGIVENAYYFSDIIHSNNYNIKGTKLALKDIMFQQQILNDENQFNVDKCIKQGYYPQLIMNSVMPNQKYIPLPEVEDKDLPDILGIEVLETLSNGATVKLSVNNPSAETITEIKIKDIKCDIISQVYQDGKSEVIVKLYEPIRYISQYSVMSITTKGAFNLPYTRKFEDDERVIYIDLYRPIYSIDDWKAINNSLTENYQLMNDLDFINEGNSIKIYNKYTGKINGNCFTIKNICSDIGVFNNLAGNIQNIKFEGYKLQIKNKTEQIGLIVNSENALLNNVQVKDVNIIVDGTDLFDTKIGVLIANSQNTRIINSSVQNAKIEVKNNIGTIVAGGLVGQSNITTVQNSFVQDCEIIIKNADSYQGIGGIIGYEGGLGQISNCYAVGTLKIEGQNVGGIVGKTKGDVKTCYSLISIETEDEFLGGVVGNNLNTASDISNNLALGDLYSKINSDTMHRVIGNSTVDGNYAYKNQKINGQETDERLGAILLTMKELSTKNTYLTMIGFENQYSYENIEQGILPKLYYQDTTNLLEGQVDNKIVEEDILKIEEVEIEKTSINEANLRLKIYNPKLVEITKLLIEDMENTILTNKILGEYTYINLVGTPTKYYDSYKIEEIEYIKDGEEGNINILRKIDIQFFKEIYSYADWQAIEIGTYQNYILMNDIDFTGKNDIHYGITVGRLEAINEQKTLKNIQLNINEQNGGLIRSVRTKLSNIKFENISIENQYKGNITGVIAISTASMENLSFSNIQINAEKMSYVGCIGKYMGSNIKNIELNEIQIAGSQYIGSLLGRTYSGIIDTIAAKSIYIKGNSNNVGGIIGYIEDIGGSYYTQNINIADSYIEGKDNVGGVIGFGMGNHLNAIDVEVIGVNNIGGIFGNKSYSNTHYGQTEKHTFFTTEDSRIYGTGSNIGGIAGNSNYMLYCSVKNTNIEMTSVNASKVGGIAGYSRGDIQYASVENTNIISAGSKVGGIIGESGHNIDFAYVRNSNIEGYSLVGGICGTQLTSDVIATYNNATIITNTHTAGGIVGYLSNKGMTATNRRIQIYNNYVGNGTIKGQSNIGGMIGDIAEDLYTAKSFYYRNYIDVQLESNESNTTSLGIGGRPDQNTLLANTYYYKYSNINGENPNEENELFIKQDQYLKEEDLKLQSTYTSKLIWSTSYFDFSAIANNKYPTLNTKNLGNQKGIDLPKDSEHIIGNKVESNSLETEILKEELEGTFEYDNKEIKTYNTYSIITATDGSKATRNVKLYVKDNNLYAIPSILSSGQNLNSKGVVPVTNNIILDNYNGKEYETVLGSDGKIYDLKEPIEYPENFANSDIESIGNNLNNNSHEVEVTYKNGDKLKFNYQTGETISASEVNSETVSLFEYLKEKISKIGDSSSNKISKEIMNEYEDGKKLRNKLEKTSIEEAIKKQNNSNHIDNVANDENNETNNSLQEQKYISIYNAEKAEYQIYKEEELLDTRKQEVISENEKIEANNLKEYYASEGEAKNTKMGIVWIALSIIGVVIILFAIKKRD